MQAYSNPKRESDPYNVPDVEVWYHQHAKRELCMLNAGHKAELYGECITDDDGDCLGSGWYWWSCLPGCLPDSEPCGPFETQEEALADAQDEFEDEDMLEPYVDDTVHCCPNCERPNQFGELCSQCQHDDDTEVSQ